MLSIFWATWKNSIKPCLKMLSIFWITMISASLKVCCWLADTLKCLSGWSKKKASISYTIKILRWWGEVEQKWIITWRSLILITSPSSLPRALWVKYFFVQKCTSNFNTWYFNNHFTYRLLAYIISKFKASFQCLTNKIFCVM